jgi:hypothetical protein
MSEETTTTPGIEEFNFEMALGLLKNGAKIARTGWNGKDMYLELQTPDEHSKMGLPYIYIKTVQDKLVPWIASHGDLLSDDWFVVIK